MSELYAAVEQEVAEFRAKINDVLADGKVTASELVPLCKAAYEGSRDVVVALHVAAERKGGSLEARKEAILDAVDKMYDEIIEPLDMPGPDSGPVTLDRFLKPGLRMAADGLVSWLQNLVHGSGKWKLVKDEDD